MRHGLDADSHELTLWLHEFVQGSSQPFNVYRHIAPGHDQQELQLLYIDRCELFVKMGLLEPHRNERGWYRPVGNDCEPMDLTNVDANPMLMWLPFDLAQKVEIYNNNVIVIAGSKSCGKTCMALNMAMMNEQYFDEIHYFNSEMGRHELKKRLDFFYRPLGAWQAKFYARANDFDAVVKSGERTLNIIDFLEVHDEFFKIGGILKKIHDRMGDSITVVFIQKNPGQETGLGGWRSMELSRLYLAVEKGTVKIVDAKNWASPQNPNGLFRDFKVVQGTKLIARHPWYEDPGKGGFR